MIIFYTIYYVAELQVFDLLDDWKFYIPCLFKYYLLFFIAPQMESNNSDADNVDGSSLSTSLLENTHAPVYASTDVINLNTQTIIPVKFSHFTKAVLLFSILVVELFFVDLH